MNEDQSVLRYECFEAGCDWTTDASSDEELVEVVGRHMAVAHDTFELEDVIIDNARVTTAETPVEARD